MLRNLYCAACHSNIPNCFFSSFAQVDRLEVVNKQYVKVILIPEADTTEVSHHHSLCLMALKMMHHKYTDVMSYQMAMHLAL